MSNGKFATIRELNDSVDKIHQRLTALESNQKFYARAVMAAIAVASVFIAVLNVFW